MATARLCLVCHLDVVVVVDIVNSERLVTLIFNYRCWSLYCQVLEDPDVYRRRRRLEAAEREKRDAEVFARLSRCPGKLDHATAVAYEVAHCRGDNDDQY